MKQVLQNLRSGQTELPDVPSPLCRPGCLLVANRRTLISAGTERMLVEFGKASLLAKARSQPDKVRQVLEKIRTDGLLPTLEAVFSRLDEPLPLGYCAAGVVLEVGAGVTGFAVGDRVASNAPHAEIACVPTNLAAKIPDGVSDEAAAFTVLASIALQGVRLLAPGMGEKYVVFGLGLIGLVAVQLLRASGCEVLGVDLSPERLKRAESYGAQVAAAGADPTVAAGAWTQGRGVDGVLITASAPTDEIVHQAATMCRKRGKIVLVGVVGLNLRRSDFYAKELTFQVSCSYGPGRYDEKYELAGQDYPLGFVRWTQQRNFQAVLDALAAGRLDVQGLVTHRFPITDAPAAYEKVSGDRCALGVILEYPAQVKATLRIDLPHAATPAAGQVVAGVIGAGSFARAVLGPALGKTPACIESIVDLNGAAAQHLAQKVSARSASSDYKALLADPRVNAVFIAVGHNLHARMVCEALAAGKHAFVEKPLAMTVDELAKVVAAAKGGDRQVMVGFNRRFSPHTVKMKQLLGGRGEPLCMSMTVNAGAIPPEHWTQDPVRGGGRIVGEGCHFIDLLVYLAGCPVTTVAATRMGPAAAVQDDKMSISLGFADGSVGTVNYFANGPKSYPKEMLEVFSDGRVLRLENFRKLVGFGFKGFHTFKTFRQDKGHAAELAAFVARLAAGGEALIPLDQLVNVTLASFAAMTSAAQARTIHLAQEYAGLLDAPSAPAAGAAL